MGEIDQPWVSIFFLFFGMTLKAYFIIIITRTVHMEDRLCDIYVIFPRCKQNQPKEN
jgi:hypothetical protein